MSRIISGIARGRRLDAPPGLGTRPMADRVKQAVFNILGQPDANVCVLDLFAGTGALALEALSRGAEAAVLVERDPRAAGIAQTNAERVGLADKVQVVCASVDAAMARLARDGRTFGWIFVDPPYATTDLEETFAALGQGTLCQPSCVVVTHHHWRKRPAERYGRLQQVDQRRYGEAQVRFYRWVV